MILYFSGTGNSKYVAKRIADALGDALVNLNDRIKASDTSPVETGERVIIVTPTYAWRIPRVVRDWLLKTELRGAKRSWFVMTCGGEMAMLTGITASSARKRRFPAWARRKSSCRRTTLRCSPRRRQTKHGKSSPKPSLASTEQLRRFRAISRSRRHGTISTTAS